MSTLLMIIDQTLRYYRNIKVFDKKCYILFSPYHPALFYHDIFKREISSNHVLILRNMLLFAPDVI